MIVWGGLDPNYADSGGVYDPAADKWTATNTAGAPTARAFHTAVWTGSRMIVWGGRVKDPSGVDVTVSTGALYDPATESWAATSNAEAPTARESHTAVWTGSKMIVWGGRSARNPWPYFDTGAVYDPATNTWTPTSTTGAPTPRGHHTAVWTGSKMIVWGGIGDSGVDNTGGVYDPATNTWTPTSTTWTPAPRNLHTAVWTGSKMIIWGGVYDFVGLIGTGGLYDPAIDTWSGLSATGAPASRSDHPAVWTGSKMVIWGGWDQFFGRGLYNTGGVYDLTTDSWTPTRTTGAPTPRAYHTAAWTGSKMIVWGGNSRSLSGYWNSGGVYDPVAVPRPTDFYTVVPCRAADTREPAGPSGGPALKANTTRTFPVTGTCGIPGVASAVAVNVTVVGETDVGDLRLYPAGDAAAGSSTINFGPGKTRANNAVVPLGSGGEVAVQCDMPAGSAGQTHFLLDVTGYFQ